MSLGQELAPHLPFLRRYARALTGTQASGDAYVRAALEALVSQNLQNPRLFQGTPQTYVRASDAEAGQLQ